MSIEFDQPTSSDSGSVNAFRPKGAPLLLIAVQAAVLEFFVLLGLAVITGQIYYWVSFGDVTSIPNHFRLGLTIALLYSVTSFFQGAYTTGFLTEPARFPERLATALSFSFFFLLIALFLTKSNADTSRAVVTLSYGIGFPALWLARRANYAAVLAMIRSGVVTQRLILLVGEPNRMSNAANDLREHSNQTNRIGFMSLKARAGDPGFMEELRTLRDQARRMSPDRVVICLPWADGATTGACVDHFMELPAAIHAKPEAANGVLTTSSINAMSGPYGLRLVGKPLRADQALFKRGFDILFALLSLTFLAPSFLAIAAFIKLDSPGPVFFRQRRYGLNRESFSVYKFRSMRQTNGPAPFRQAQRGDERITRIGKFMRQSNLDELPQLINVLKGDMSIVGPRPHPVELDDAYVNRISHYSMRHRVRPGITGWAQINGFRGVTDTDDKMQGRISHDLHYLANWSFWLDIQIILRTAFSAKSYKAAV